MSIPHWPEQERPRERLIQQGPEALSDAELLAIFLRTGTKGKSAVELAREALKSFGGLKHLHQVELAEWQTIQGLGPAKFAQLKACMELAKRSLLQEFSNTANTPLDNPKRVVELVRAHIAWSKTERFLAIALNSQLHVLDARILFTGTINQTMVYPRELALFALQHHATRMIVAHNHPSNCCQPSQSDLNITEKIKGALNLLDCELVDHIIVGPNCHLSLRETGFL